MYQLLQTYKPLIDQRIDLLTESTVNSDIPWSRDVAERLAETSKRGKGVRGALLLATKKLFTGTVDNCDISLAVALEYLHTALLIHDDLLDHDNLRRGKPSLHKQYELLGEDQTLENSSEFGKAMALCVGDIAIFGGFSFIAGLEYDPKIIKQLVTTITQEFLLVGFGELEDIALTYTHEYPTIEKVLTMYRYKTARYTFSLPFILASVLTGQNKQTEQTLDHLGEKFGLLFQLSDDMLTLSGDVETVGKTIGNDISENKKTIYNILLHQRADDQDKEILCSIFGRSDINSDDIYTVQTLMNKYAVAEDIKQKIVELEQEARVYINDLPHQAFFEDILTFLLTRKK